MGTVKRIALVLVIIGGINWGLIGLFQFDLVASLFGGQNTALSRIIYSLVGLGALFSIPILFSPLDETEVDNRGSIQSGRVNYGTEFGEEEQQLSNRNTDNDK